MTFRVIGYQSNSEGSREFHKGFRVSQVISVEFHKFSGRLKVFQDVFSGSWWF